MESNLSLALRGLVSHIRVCRYVHIYEIIILTSMATVSKLQGSHFDCTMITVETDSPCSVVMLYNVTETLLKLPRELSDPEKVSRSTLLKFHSTEKHSFPNLPFLKYKQLKKSNS